MNSLLQIIQDSETYEYLKQGYSHNFETGLNNYNLLPGFSFKASGTVTSFEIVRGSNIGDEFKELWSTQLDTADVLTDGVFKYANKRAILAVLASRIGGSGNFIYRYTIGGKKYKSQPFSITGLIIPDLPDFTTAVIGETYENSNDGSITVNVIAGEPPYEYSINGGAFQGSNVFSGLTADTYLITVKDFYGLEVSKNVQVVQLYTKLVLTIDTTLGPDSNFSLPFREAYNYNTLVKWGDTKENIITSWDQAEATHVYASEGIYQIEIHGLIESIYFQGYSLESIRDKLVSVDQFGETGLIAIDNGFNTCRNLNSLASDNLDAFTNCDSFYRTWRNCYALSAFPQFNTENITTFYEAWSAMTSLVSFPELNVQNLISCERAWVDCEALTTFGGLLNSSNVENYNSTWKRCLVLNNFPSIDISGTDTLFYTWSECESLTSFPLIDTSNIIYLTGSWHKCYNLTSFPLINTSSVETALQAWKDCGSLTSFPQIDTINITDLNSTWSGCTGLTSFPQINTINVTDLNSTWSSCSGLTSFPVINTSNVSIFSNTWSLCTGLTTFWEVNTSSATTFFGMFQESVNITTITNIGNWDISGVTEANNMFTNVTLDVATYTSLLIGWQDQGPSIQSGIYFDGGKSQYDQTAIAARKDLIETYGWTITDRFGPTLKMTIDTTLGVGDSFQLPLIFGLGLPYDFDINWGDTNTDTITSWDQAETLHNYAAGGIYQIEISGICSAWSFNDGGDKDKVTSIDLWGHTGFKDLGKAFYGCSNLTAINDTLGDWFNTVEIANMMFRSSGLTSIDMSNWDVRSVTTIQQMFTDATGLTDVGDLSGWVTDSLTNIAAMFHNCSLITQVLGVGSWNVTQLVYANSMFLNVTLNTANYDSILIGWEAQSVLNNVFFHGGGSKYSAGAAATARAALIADHSWDITDGGQV